MSACRLRSMINQKLWIGRDWMLHVCAKTSLMSMRKKVRSFLSTWIPWSLRLTINGRNMRSVKQTSEGKMKSFGMSWHMVAGTVPAKSQAYSALTVNVVLQLPSVKTLIIILKLIIQQLALHCPFWAISVLCSRMSCLYDNGSLKGMQGTYS